MQLNVLFPSYPSGVNWGWGARLGAIRRSVSNKNSSYTFSMTLRSVFIDIFIWTAFSFYFIRVIQGDYGRKYPLYFQFTVSYWCPGRINRKSEVGPSVTESSWIPLEAVPMALKEHDTQVCIITNFLS